MLETDVRLSLLNVQIKIVADCLVTLADGLYVSLMALCLFYGAPMMFLGCLCVFPFTIYFGLRVCPGVFL